MKPVHRLLQLSLEMKLLVPNVAVITIAATAFTAAGRSGSVRLEYLAVLVLVLGAVLNFILVRIALRPVKAMQIVAEEVAGGNLSARVKPSIIADPGLAHLAVTFNETLVYLGQAREEIRERGARIVYAQELERASVARELHESIGQTLAAASYLAGAAANACAGSPTEVHCREVASLLRTAMENLRNLSRNLHPRVADDLGLPTALEALARATMGRSLVDVQLSVSGFNEAISSAASSTFYRIARDTLRTIETNMTHGTVTVAIFSDAGRVQLEINDDCIFDGTNGRKLRESLSSQAERLSLLGGDLLVETNLQGGSRVLARLGRQQEAA